MSVDELFRRRWSKNSKPDQHAPTDAVKALEAAIADGLDPAHIVILVDDKADRVHYFQAGDHSHLTSIGLLERVKYLMLSGS